MPILDWTIVFLVVVVVTGILGFSGLAVAGSNTTGPLFAVFLILFIVSWLGHAGYIHTSL